MQWGDRWLIRTVTVGGRPTDVRIAEGRVVEIGAALAAREGESILDGRGGELLPGLADHHIHLLSLAASRISVDLHGRPLSGTLTAAGSGWLRVIGSSEELRRRDVDAVWPDRPVRVLHRSGALWTLNSQAVEQLASVLTPEESSSGQVWRSDRRLGQALRFVNSGLDEQVRAVGTELASWGITHITDATPDLDRNGIERIRENVPQRLLSMSVMGEGPRKIIVPDHADVEWDRLRGEVGGSHAEGRPVAIHAVSRVALAVAIALLDDVGAHPGDRIEHAAMCDDPSADRLAGIGITVVTQPTIFGRHGDAFIRETPQEERPLLWRHAGLVRRGVRVVVSSDAPHGSFPPAETLRVCAGRPVEGVPPAEAFRSFLLPPDDLRRDVRRVARGAPADLCLLSGSVEAAIEAMTSRHSNPVGATFVAGELVHQRVQPPRRRG